ncbi:hypothetical protein C8J57DRAFT_1078341 [Mycena rebaudengoi]|nr:hypothetical protein C8J57DRAFT_1078341 [Mycena rebaudengoi]
MTKLDSLKDRGINPPFKHSVFSTAEWCFGDAASPPVKHKFDVFYTFCAITAIGDYAPSRGQIIFWKDGNALPFIPGTTVLFPAGCQNYSFAAVQNQETRFYFKQYFNAALFRWVDKGRMSDTQFADYASKAETERMSAARVNRGELAASLYSKLQDIFIV